MSGRVTGYPVRLESYTDTTAPTVAPTLAGVDGYAAALRAFRGAAPNDLCGPVLSGWQTYARARDGDVVGAIFAGAAVVGTGILLVASAPVTLTAGAILVGGALIYEFRSEIADAGRWVWRKASDVGGAVASTASNLGNAVVGGAVDAAGAAGRFLGGLKERVTG